MTDLNLAVIGNCRFCALIDRNGRISQCGLPQFDSDPVFCALLDGDADSGYWDFELVGFKRASQKYIENTAVVETLLYDSAGGIVRITDFAPRGAEDRPAVICRLVEPLAGKPRLRVRLRPRFEYGQFPAKITAGDGHVRYEGPQQTLYL
ncbi:MAG: glycoside hydrolase family 15 protein, partial [Alphaproteobacteria bacterium]|nr:glycoside hydrolase family 15 protein [Alphaproteobacteria bacterium]